MQKKLSLGIIGAGDIVSQVHLPCLLAMENIVVDWITDINTVKVERIAAAYKLRYLKLPGSLEDLPSADIYLLAVPFGARPDYYAALRGKGAALYVEKPFAKTVDFHNQICSWFPPYALACGFQRRVDGSTQTLINIIKNELFGKLTKIEFGFGQPGVSTGGKFYSKVDLAGGGILLEQAIHGIDTILFCAGAKKVRITSGFMIMDKGFDLHTEARLRLTDSSNNEFDCNIMVSSLEETIRTLRIHFEKAIVDFTVGSNQIQIRSKDGADAYVMKTTTKGMLPDSAFQTFYLFWSHFLRGLESQEENLTSASQSLLTTEAIERLYNLEKRGL
jgi:predicted dehydrogenase